ncbi:hypothetical protein Tco_0670960 [Tanacetum coccineum]
MMVNAWLVNRAISTKEEGARILLMGFYELRLGYGSSRPESKTWTKASNRRLPICSFTQDPDEHSSLMLSLVDCSSSTICSQLKYNEDTREVVKDEQSTKEHAKVTTKRVKGRAKQTAALKAYKVKTDIRKGQYHTDDDPYFIQLVVKRNGKSFHSDTQDFLKNTNVADVDDTAVGFRALRMNGYQNFPGSKVAEVSPIKMGNEASVDDQRTS